MGKSLNISPTVQFIKEEKLAIETNIVPGCKHDGLHRSLDLFLESALCLSCKNRIQILIFFLLSWGTKTFLPPNTNRSNLLDTNIYVVAAL